MKINPETGKYEWQYLNKEEWHKIEEELGDVTDFEIKEHKDSKHLKIEIHYKSNGIPKVTYLSNFTPLIHSFLYCIKEFHKKHMNLYSKQ